MEITPDEYWEQDKMLRILRMKWKQIESTIGPFVPAGRSILTLSEISETIEWNIDFRGDNIKVKIAAETGKPRAKNDSAG